MSHRISLPVLNNDFLTEQPDGLLHNTASDVTCVIGDVWWMHQREIVYHRANGYSPNCVICRDEARKSALPAVPAAETGDPLPLYVEQMQARFATLEAALTDDMPRERADEIMTELVDLQFAIEKAHGAMDDRGEWAMRQKRGDAL